MIIAIDGPAASGKGTLGKRLAHHYGYRHLDTGVIYRAVAKAMLDLGADLTDEAQAVAVASELDPEKFGNPALKTHEAEDWEQAAGPDEAAIRLIEAMAGDAVLPGFTARAELGLPRKTGGIEVQLVAEYSGAELVGQRLVLRNLGKEPLDLAADREGPAGTIAFAYGRDALRPGETTSAFLVFRKGGLE